MRFMPIRSLILGLSLAAVSFAQGGGRGMQQPAPPAGPWMDKSLPPDQRADMVIAQMTIDEKIQLVHGGQAGRGDGGAATDCPEAMIGPRSERRRRPDQVNDKGLKCLRSQAKHLQVNRF